jgi:ribosomal protein S12 methylthiotransferase accessory factor
MGSAREIQIVLAGDRRVDARMGEYLVHTDQPKDKGGGGSAPSPFDLFLASLGTCAGIFVQGFCAQREIPFEQIRITEQVEFDDAGVLARVDIKLELPPEFPEKYRAALLKVVEQCSVKKAIAAQPKFEVHY